MHIFFLWYERRWIVLKKPLETPKKLLDELVRIYGPLRDNTLCVEILNNMTLIHRDYPDYTLLRNTCTIHNLFYVDHQFSSIKNNETLIACAH